MKKTSLWLLGLLALTCACQPEKSTHIDQLFETSAQLTLSDVDIPSSQIPSPYTTSSIINDNIIITNLFGDKLLTIFDIQNNYKKTDILNRGHANNEMLHILKMSCFDDKIYLYGSPNKLLILDNNYLNDSSSIISSSDLNLTLLSNIIPLDEAKYYASIVSTYDTTLNLLCLMDEKLNVISGFGPLSSYDLDASLPDYDKLMGLQGKLERNGAKNSIVYTSNFGSIISFYRISERDVSKTKEYIFEVPKFKSNSNPERQIYGVVQSQDNICGTISLKAKGDNCYLLYTDDLLKDNNEYTSSVIYVFDFAGNPIQKYVLSDKVNAIIGFSENSIYFYGSNSDGEPIIKKAQL